MRKVKFALPKDREKWEKVLTLDFMSSEDSGSDEGDEILIIRPIPCRSSKVDRMFSDLDQKTFEDKSPRARRQMKQRKVGIPSKRPRPTHDCIPQWALSD